MTECDRQTRARSYGGVLILNLDLRNGTECGGWAEPNEALTFGLNQYRSKQCRTEGGGRGIGTEPERRACVRATGMALALAPSSATRHAGTTMRLFAKRSPYLRKFALRIL